LNNYKKLNKEQILCIVRQVLTATGANLITLGLMNEGPVTEILGTIMTLVSTVWSVIDKTDTNMAKKAISFNARMKKN
jgi:hypothetical protein